MSGTADDANPPRVQIATFIRGTDGRFVDVDILPEPDPALGEDQVLTWDAETQRPKWQRPSDLGFSAVPMILDVPVADGSGALLADGDGRIIVANVPSVGS